MKKRDELKRKNTFDAKRELPKGISVYKKKRKDGSVIITKKSRYEIARGERRVKIFECLEIEAKNIDNFLKQYIGHQLTRNGR